MASNNLSLDWWEKRLVALYQAYTSNASMVRFEGREERYKSQEDLWDAILFARGMIDSLKNPAPASASGPVRTTRVDQNDYI